MNSLPTSSGSERDDAPEADGGQSKGQSPDSGWALAIPIVTAVVTVAPIVGGGLYFLQPSLSALILWASMASLLGALFGFVFALPKVIQTDRLESHVDEPVLYRQMANNNLYEISDWLTKIIVGVGLINVNNVGSYIKDISNVLSLAISDSNTESSSASAVAIGITVGFSVLGFLYGYLSTRLYLPPRLKESDTPSPVFYLKELSEIKDVLEPAKSNGRDLEVDQKAGAEADEARVEDGEPQQTHEPTTDNMALIKEDLVSYADKYQASLDSEAEPRGPVLTSTTLDAARKALRAGLDKDQIAEMAEEKPSPEGYAAILASVITSNPELSDIDLLYRMHGSIRGEDARYRIVMALISIYQSRPGMPVKYKRKIKEIICAYYESSGRKLVRLIESFMSVSGINCE
jgi:hypothetical protein